MNNPYSSAKQAVKKAIQTRSDIAIPHEKIEKCRKNNLYSGTTDIFTAIIEDKDGVVKNQKAFSDYVNAVLWSKGMLSESKDGVFKILDTDSKTILESGRKLNDDWVKYANKPEVKEVVVPGLELPVIPKQNSVTGNEYRGEKTLTTKLNAYFGTVKNAIVEIKTEEETELEKGVEKEMEHAELIKKILGSGATLTQIRSVARKIAMDHIAEDAQYYTKLSKVVS